MSLTVGARFGSYDIVSALGAGGMGEVYRATDTKLKRQVAIKILPPQLAADPDRLARFQREAEVLASLNHPHIASIYGLEHADGINALVIELVEGEDLAERIARGPVPVDEALPLAKQIAEALEAAHEDGVIHRDLKPANIKLRADGTVKVLDFGLAKLTDPAVGRPGRESLPTITSPAMMTSAGVILGTAAYMSPEQARGNVADKRADIWAFGAVLYEMLTGTRAFGGETVSDTLASVLKTDPNWQALPADTPTRLRRLLRSCLAKDPKRRLRDIGDARMEIEDLIANSAEESDPRPIARNPSLSARLAMLTLAGALIASIVAAAIIAPQWHRASPAPFARLSAELGADVTLVTRPVSDAISLSRDGSVLAFVGQKDVDAPVQLYVRRLNEQQAMLLPGTEGADCPFFSPDGQWIGFFADGRLKKIGVRGGAAIVLSDAPIGRGGDWGDDGSIVFLPNRFGGIMRVSSSNAGVAPEPVTTMTQGEVTHRWPQLLPGGKAVLFTSNTAAASQSGASLVVQQLPSGERKVIQKGYHGRYLPSGHLVYLHDGTLFATAFDPNQLKVTGPSVPVLEGVASNAGTGAAWFAVSDTGLFAYVEGPNVVREGIPIAWMTRQGKTTPMRTTREAWLNLAFSPNGNRLAFERMDDIWMYDWLRDSAERLTSDPAADTNPTWTPDGARIAFASTRGNAPAPNIYWQRVDETANAQRLTESPNEQHPGSWHPSGRFLAFEEVHPTTGADLMILPMEGDEASGWRPGKPTVFANGLSDERTPVFSPDGRWIAYVSNDTGRNEVFVRAFQGTGRWPVSVAGGLTPTWSRTKQELYYETANVGQGGRLVVVPYSTDGDVFQPHKAELLTAERHETRGPNRMFDLHPDGTRFALAPFEQTTGGLRRNHVTFLFNYFDELRRLAPRSP